MTDRAHDSFGRHIIGQPHKVANGESVKDSAVYPNGGPTWSLLNQLVQPTAYCRLAKAGGIALKELDVLEIMCGDLATDKHIFTSEGEFLGVGIELSDVKHIHAFLLLFFGLLGNCQFGHFEYLF